jgi:hypothetical protein
MAAQTAVKPKIFVEESSYKILAHSLNKIMD